MGDEMGSKKTPTNELLTPNMGGKMDLKMDLNEHLAPNMGDKMDLKMTPTQLISEFLLCTPKLTGPLIWGIKLTGP